MLSEDQRPSPVGIVIRRHRLAAGLTQHELAQRAGLSERALRELEQGRSRHPRAASVSRLATALALSPEQAQTLLTSLSTADPERQPLHIGVLGPMVVTRGGSPLEIPSPLQRALLGLLALHRGRVVSTGEIIDVLWGENPPRTSRKLVQAYVSQLRTLLGAARGQPRSARAGYTLDLTGEQLDLAQFDDLTRRACAEQSADRPEQAAALYARALQYWRGQVLADAEARLRHHPTAVDTNRRRIAATIALADLAIATGGADQVVAALRTLSHEEPLHEAVHGRLMLTLATTGEPGAALRVYADLRARLADELGVEPGPELQTTHLRILRGQIPHAANDSRAVTTHPGATEEVIADPDLTHSAAPTGRMRHVPRQLPAPPQVFTGRVTELADLVKVHDASTVVITAIDGMAGVGKTALAVHAAHQMVDRYPDGQLFIDLHGYTDGVAPVDPSEALDRMLRLLGVAGEGIPADVDERAGLYRSRLADRRMLIVLDNAATETQVAPLLPGAPGCVVLVTSRRRLAGLDPTDTLSLDALPRADAVALLRQTAGESRLAGQPPELLTELVERCGCLPLAIRIAAARLRAHPAWDLAHLVGRLHDRHHWLMELQAGQRSVTATLDLSYQDLDVDVRRAYRLLGLHPGPDIEPYAAVALLDRPLPKAGRMLEQLLEAHLLQEPLPGRYRFHDLVRAHAGYVATRCETGPGRHEALDRLLDYYGHAAAVAMDAAYPYERERRPQVQPAHILGPDLPDPAAALTWLDGELPNLLASARYATENDRPEHILHLSTTLHRHLRNRGPFQDAVTLHQQALTTARRTGNDAAELAALAGLGHIQRQQGRYEQATDHYQQALQGAGATGHQVIEFEVLVGLANIHMMQGRREQATGHYQRALQLARSTGHRPGELTALTGLGHIHRLQGRHEQATEYFQQALQLARSTGHRPGELNVLVSLGLVYRCQGRYGQATEHYQRALQLARSTGHRTAEQAALAGLGHLHRRQSRYAQAADDYQRLLDLARQCSNSNNEFEAWQGLGRLWHATGHPDAALTHHQQALTLATELGQPDDQARAHDGLAHAHQALHQHEQARTHWQHALDILTALGIDHTDDEEATVAAIRARLTGHNHQCENCPGVRPIRGPQAPLSMVRH